MAGTPGGKGETSRVADVLSRTLERERRWGAALATDARRLARYPEQRARLERLAARSEMRARRLAEALGVPLPTAAAISHPEGATTWRRLRRDLEWLSEGLEQDLEDAYGLERDHPELSALLLELRHGRAEDRREFVRVLATLEPAVLDRPDPPAGADFEPPAGAPETVPVGGRLDIDGIQ
jgi:hypothetical protein